MALFLFTSTPPRSFCLPKWYYLIQEWEDKYGKISIPSGCPYDEATGDIQCSIEKVRANSEAAAQKSGVWRGLLTQDTISLARTMRSEHGSGTPADKVAIAWASVNRGRASGKGITGYTIHRDRKTYGKQSGGIRPVSTKADPKLSDLFIARAILRGEIPDPTNGATHYFNVVVQADMSRKKPGSFKPPLTVYQNWSKSLQWVGHVPGVDPKELLLMGPKKGSSEFQKQAYDAGLLILQNKNPQPPAYADCKSPKWWLWSIGAGVVGSLAWFKWKKRSS